MSKTKRNNNPQPALQPDFSKPVPCGEDHYGTMAAELIRLRHENKQQKTLIAGERKRHAGTEALTLRLVYQLEQSVLDLRSACFQNLGRQFTSNPATPKENK